MFSQLYVIIKWVIRFLVKCPFDSVYALHMILHHISIGKHKNIYIISNLYNHAKDDTFCLFIYLVLSFSILAIGYPTTSKKILMVPSPKTPKTPITYLFYKLNIFSWILTNAPDVRISLQPQIRRII